LGMRRKKIFQGKARMPEFCFWACFRIRLFFSLNCCYFIDCMCVSANFLPTQFKPNCSWTYVHFLKLNSY
jgi:hypothetical protein